MNADNRHARTRRGTAPARPVPPRPATGSARRGVIVLLFLFFLVIAVLMTALALNWSYLVLVQRDMQFRGDAVALAAAPALLDQNLLKNLPPDQSDNLSLALAVADHYRLLNNAANSERLRLEADDVLVEAGYLANVEQTVSGGDFTASEPYNTLRVTVLRQAAGANPVRPLVNGFWNADPVDVAATSYVTLDNRLVGFRPTESANAPLLPIALAESAWQNQPAGQDNYTWTFNNGDFVLVAAPNQNQIKELDIRLNSSDPDAAAGNAVLVSFDGGPVVQSALPAMIAAGVSPADLVPSGQLGPATPGNPLPLPAEETAASKAATASLAAALNLRAGDRRVIPLYGGFAGGTAQIVGFAGVRILLAEDEETDPEYRLRLIVEPCFVVHFTAWTDPAADENPWIHKLRLRR